MVLLEIENFSVKFRGSDIYALKNVSLNGEKGELIIVAGKSGCGKSTLAQAILGLIPKLVNAETAGTILINNKSILQLTRAEIIENIGYVPQYPADYTVSLLVEEEISFSLENLALHQDEIKSRIDSSLRSLSILHLKYRLITELSSGELQKVALATAIACEPKILILDEPMARLDPKSEIELVQTLHKLLDQERLVMVFEHRLDYLLPYADRLIVLDDGQLIQSGNPREILGSLSGVDLPEISELAGANIKSPSIDINEITESLGDFFSQKK